jgi:hypothetical protein
MTARTFSSHTPQTYSHSSTNWKEEIVNLPTELTIVISRLLSFCKPKRANSLHDAEDAFDLLNHGDQSYQNTHFVFRNLFITKSCRWWDSVEEYGSAGQATGDNTIRRMRLACWITKATDNLRTCNIYCNDYGKSSQYYVIRALPIMLFVSTLHYKWHDFRGKKLLNIQCLGFLYNFVWKISHSKKNWGRYDNKCT